jgi:hypothetical protein
LVEAKAAVAEISFLGCEGGALAISESTVVVDLLAGSVVGDSPAGTFCGVQLEFVPSDLDYPSPGTTAPGDLSLGLLVQSDAGGALSFESSAAAAAVLGAVESFTLDGTEDLLLSLDVAQLLVVQALDTPLGADIHLIDPSHAPDAMTPSPLQESFGLYLGTAAEGGPLSSGEIPSP